MAARSDIPVEPVPATGALGQEAIVGAALAEPQVPDPHGAAPHPADQLAALPDAAPPSSSAPADAPVGDSAAPVGSDDGAPQLAAIEPTAHLPHPDPVTASPATDLAPAMGAVPPPISEATIGHITV